LGPSRALMIHALDSGVSPNYYVTVMRHADEAQE
jgi:hypothetical protein